jgi:hypothetical protein
MGKTLGRPFKDASATRGQARLDLILEPPSKKLINIQIVESRLVLDFSAAKTTTVYIRREDAIKFAHWILDQYGQRGSE